MADGTLKFDTRVDTSGMKKDLQGVQTVAKGVFTADIVEKFAAEAGKAIAGLAKNMVEVGSAFESAMSQVAATMGITTDQIAAGSADFEKLSAAAKEMGATTKYTAAEAAEGLNILAMAGLSADEAIETLPSVLSLAAAGAMDMGTAASYVTGAVKGYADSMDNAGMYADIMAKGATMANTDVNALGAALSGSAASANAYGQSVDTAAIALLRLAEQNVTGQEAATAMNRAMADLYTPTANGAKALKELGVSMYDTNGDAKDFNDVVDELNAALSGMSMEEKLAYENTIFTTFGMKAFQKMTVSTSEKVEEFAEGIRNASGSAMQQMNTQIDNLEGKLTILNSATEAVGIEFYEIFEDTMKNAVDHATDAMSNFQKALKSGNLADSMDKLAKAIGNFADKSIDLAEDALPKMIDGLAFILDHSTEIGAGITGVAAAFVAWKVATFGVEEEMIKLNAIIMANPYAIAAAAIVGITTALVAYTEASERASFSVNESVKETKELTESARELNKEIADGKAAREESRQSYESEDAVLQKLSERFAELTSQQELSAEEQDELKNVVQQLNSAYPDLNIQLDENCKLIGSNTDEILDNIEALKKQTRAKAAQADLEDIANQQYEAEKKLYEIEKKRQQAEEDAKASRQKYNEELQAAFELTGDMATAEAMVAKNYNATQEACDALNEEYEATQKTLEELDEEFEFTTQYLEENGSAAEEAAGSNEVLADSMETVSNAASGMSEEMADAYESLTKSVESSIESQTGLFEEFDSAQEVTFENVKGRLAQQIEAMSSWADNVKILAERGIDQGLLYELETMGPEGAAYVQAFVDMTGNELASINSLYAQKAAISEEAKSIVTNSWVNAASANVNAYTEAAVSGSTEAQQAGEAVADESLQGMVGSSTWNSMSEEARKRITETANQETAAAVQSKQAGKAVSDNTMAGMVGAATWASLPKTVQDQMKKTTDEATKAGASGAKNTGKKVTDTLGNTIKSNEPTVSSAMRQTTKSVINTMNQTAGTTSGPSTESQATGRQIDSGLALGIQNNQSTAENAARGLIKAVNSALNSEASYDSYREIGQNIAKGLAQGMRDKKSEVEDAGKELGKSATDSTKKETEVHSPSRKFKWIGEMCVAGFAEGLEPLTNGSALGAAADAIGQAQASKTSYGTANINNSVTVTLEGDAKKLFNVMRQQNDIFERTTGQSAFA